MFRSTCSSVSAGRGGVDGVHVTPQASQIRPEVGGAERREELLNDLAAGVLERPLEGGARLVAEREVLGDDRDLPVLEGLVDPLAERVGRLARRPARAHDVLAAPTLGQILGGDGRRERRDLAALDVRQERVGFRGAQRSDEELHALALDERPRLREGGGGLRLGILDEQLDLARGQALALLLEVELEAVLHLLAVRRQRPRLGH